MEKERSVKLLIISILFMLIAGLTVAFAALSTTLNINGTAYLDAAKWGIKFENLSEPVKVGNASVVGTSKIEETKSAEITGINVNLSTPGDKVTYTVDLVNEGTINAKIDKIEKTQLTSEQQRYLTFKVADQNGKEVSEGDILSAGETRNLTITIEFIKDLTKEDLPKQTSTISLSYKLNFVQTDEKATTSGSSKQACTTFDKKDTYNVGDVIALCNTSTNKSEDFYVMKDNGTTVTALAKYNLLIGNALRFNDDLSNITPEVISSSDNEYGLQSSKTLIDFYWKDGKISFNGNIIYGLIQFYGDSDDTEYSYWEDQSSYKKPLAKYGSSYPAEVFDSNSLLYKPLKTYETYIKKNIGKNTVTLDILSLEQAKDLGILSYSNIDSDKLTLYPTWYNNTFYWLSTADDNRWMYIVNSGVIETDNFYRWSNGSYTINGIRSVITISKSEL
jgi:hypothetical protein